MTIISKADADVSAAAGTIPVAEIVGGGATNTDALPSAYSGGTLNDNGADARRFDITAKANVATTWLIGAAKLEALMTFGLGAAADWTDNTGVLEICTNVAGSAVPASLDIHAGNVVTGSKCTAVY